MALFHPKSVFAKSFDTTRTIVLANSLQLLWMFPLAVAQDVCSKYCWDSCHAYFPGSEFSRCVTANVDCDCSRVTDIRNPLIIFGIIIIIIACCLAACCCRRRPQMSSTSLPPRSIVAEPVVNTMNSSSLNQRVKSWDYSSGIRPPSYDASHRSQYFMMQQQHTSGPTSDSHYDHLDYLDSHNDDTACSAPSFSDACAPSSNDTCAPSSTDACASSYNDACAPSCSDTCTTTD